MHLDKLRGLFGVWRIGRKWNEIRDLCSGNKLWIRLLVRMFILYLGYVKEHIRRIEENELVDMKGNRVVEWRWGYQEGDWIMRVTGKGFSWEEKKMCVIRMHGGVLWGGGIGALCLGRTLTDAMSKRIWHPIYMGHHWSLTLYGCSIRLFGA